MVRFVIWFLPTLYKLLILPWARSCFLKDGCSVVLVLQRQILRRFWMMNLEKWRRQQWCRLFEDTVPPSTCRYPGEPWNATLTMASRRAMNRTRDIHNTKYGSLPLERDVRWYRMLVLTDKWQCVCQSTLKYYISILYEDRGNRTESFIHNNRFSVRDLKNGPPE
jgi:hypothetical protein